MAGQLEFRLTAQGRAKLNRVYKNALSSSRFAFKEGSEKIVKPNISKSAPGLDEERRLISIGVITKPYVSPSRRGRTGMAGASDERRFHKGPDQFSVKQAVLMEPVEIKREREVAKVYLGRTSLYNPGRNPRFSIGFSWRGAHQERSTDDSTAGAAWQALLEKWEFGGTFSVTPRGPNLYLEPERGVLAKGMAKTIPQFGMFRKGGQASREPLRKHIESKVKKMVGAEFGR